ncbi:MAG: ROK family protein [Myxococcota bacterium]|nr:ROK family protein [Myxococcota bacterium]
MLADYSSDPRGVMTLDGGGTSFRFSAMLGGRTLTETFVTPSHANDLEQCLANMIQGFARIRDQCAEPPAAISLAFPGPADYPNGVIGDLPNLPAFRGGVALGPMLEERFGVPVYINNDGNLFVYGEAIAGLLPYANEILQNAGSSKRFRHLFGVTLGTGFGGGIAWDGQLHVGDNSMAGEVWLLRNKLYPHMAAEEGACARGVRRAYAENARIAMDRSPEPKVIFDIGIGKREGNKAAAVEAFRQLGEVAGDALAHGSTLVDGLVVIGGGISGAWPLFLPTLVAEMNGAYTGPAGNRLRRLGPVAFNLEDAAQRERFAKGEMREIRVPGGDRRLVYDSLQRIGVGLSRLGTSEAVAVGAYVFALKTLDRCAPRPFGQAPP